MTAFAYASTITPSRPNPSVLISTESIKSSVFVFSPPVATMTAPNPVKSLAFFPSELSENVRSAFLMVTEVSASVPTIAANPVLAALLSLIASPNSDFTETFSIRTAPLSTAAASFKFPVTSDPDIIAPRIKVLETPFSAHAGIKEPVVVTASSAVSS